MGLQPAGRYVDQTRPITQIEIEIEIMRLSARLEQETGAYAAHIQAAAENEATYKRVHAIAYLKATGTVAEREAWADLKSAEEFQHHKNTDALAKASKEALASLRDQIRALQTLAANVRTQVTQTGY
jgi:hypothetical protein